MQSILFFKANPNHDARGRFTFAPAGGRGSSDPPASSASISSESEARSYWRQRFGGKELKFEVQQKAGPVRATVYFDPDTDHAYTDHIRDAAGRRTGGRAFSAERARLMDQIPAVLQRPTNVFLSHDNHLFIGHLNEQGEGYLVSLAWRAPRKLYVFSSAYPVTKEAWATLRRELRPARPHGPPLQKAQTSETPQAFASGAPHSSLPVFEHSEAGYSGGFPRPPGRTAETVEGRADATIVEDLGAFFKALPAGARWITVRPNGPGTEGQPVMIQPAGDGSYRVIGGAGGKLNYLKLTGVKDQASYKEEAAKRSQTRREIAKDQRQKDKAAGILEAKQRARQAVRDQLAEHEGAFVSQVADALGWTDEQMRFPEEKFSGASDAAVSKARQRHAREVYRQAVAAVDLQRQRLVADAEARGEAGIGEVPLTSVKPEEISVEDLAPVGNEGGGLGFAAKYGERAEARGLTKEELAGEATAAKPPPKNPQAPKQRKEKAAAIAEELQGIRDAGPAIDAKQVVDARKAVELLKAKKALDAARKAGRARRAEIDKAKTPDTVEPKAFVIELGNKAPDEAVVADLENDLRTLRTQAFLSEIGKQTGGDLAPLGRHLGVGAFNSVNALALAAGGAALLDRSVVDVLGPGGAAQVLARRLASDLAPEEFDQVKEAMGRFHVQHYMRVSQDALRQARDAQEAAQAIELPDAATGADFAVAQELNAKRRKLVGDAQRVLGQALGEMETNAAIVAALEQPQRDALHVSLGKTDVESAIRQARAIGLQRGDYQVEKIGGTTMLTVTGAGQDRLAQPIDRADLQRTRDSLAIINGDHDEEDWLPKGVADRPDMAMETPSGVAPRIASPFPQAPADMDTAVADYIGGRTADGDSPAAILRDLLSEDVIQRAGDRAAFMAAVDKVAPLYDGDGKMVRHEAHAAAFEKLADAYVQRLGGERTPLHRQKVEVDQHSVDALHRALMAHPEGTAAFKPVGELTPQDQGVLRAAFAREHGRTDPEAEKLRAELEAHTKAEPEKETQGLFGAATNPEWTEWSQRRDELAEAANKATMTWPKYVAVLGSPQRAYAAMQDVVRSDVIRSFAETHNRLKPASPLKIGRTAIAHDLRHLDALDPDARARREADQRQLVDRLRTRVQGQYAAGSVAGKLDAARAAEAAAAQAQMGLFGASEEPAAPEGQAAPAQEEPLQLGQRWTVGHAAEQTVAGMMPHVGAMFRGNTPVAAWRPSMSGRYVKQQRAVKLIRQNRRVQLALGAGSGKTGTMLSAFTDAHADGAAKRGLFLVPSIVQGQFHGEALNVLEPGKYRWHADPGASREERIAAYRDPGTHFSVVTHQAFRDDMLHLAARRESTTPAAIGDKLEGMSDGERSAYMRDLMAAEGIDHDYLAVDEGHNLLNRAGKQNSRLANVVDAVSAGMGHYVNATADPVKNDVSEAFDTLRKMNPAKYQDRDAFMRKYGVDTDAAREGLKREMAQHYYTSDIPSGVKVNRQTILVKPDANQTAALAAVDAAAAQARIARMKGGVDMEALRRLSPASFEGAPEAEHASIAKKLNRSIGILRNTALRHAVGGGAKTEDLAAKALARKGKQGVVFAHNLDRVKEIADRLAKDGHRVVTLTGADSSAEKDRKKAAYKAGKHDIIVMSDAGAVGANLQTGQWLAQYDTPDTAMIHYQRNRRIDRLGQQNDIELLDFVTDHPTEHRARERLAKKYDLREVMTSPLEGLDDTGLAGMLNQIRTGRAAAEEPVFGHAQEEDSPVLGAAAAGSGGAPAEEEQRSLF